MAWRQPAATPTGTSAVLVTESVTTGPETQAGHGGKVVNDVTRLGPPPTPAYVLFSGGTKGGGLFRAALGGDVGITSSLGATLGIEFGGKRPRGLGGPTGSLYGFGLSYALGHR
jgi:hypothetical protein